MVVTALSDTVYSIFMACYILLLPLEIICCCHFKIDMAIWNRDLQERVGLKHMINHSSTSPGMSVKKRTISTSRRKVVFMAMSVQIAYLVCFTPCTIISLSGYIIIIQCH